MADILTLSNKMSENFLMTPQLLETLKQDSIESLRRVRMLPTREDSAPLDEAEAFYRQDSQESDDLFHDEADMFHLNNPQSSPFIGIVHARNAMFADSWKSRVQPVRRKSCNGRSFGDLETIQEIETTGPISNFSRSNVHESCSRAAKRFERRARSGELPVILKQMIADRLAEAEHEMISRDDSDIKTGRRNGSVAPEQSPAPDTFSIHVLYRQKTPPKKAKSLLLANEARETSKTGTFDTVAVSFWLAQLELGTTLMKISNSGDSEGKTKDFSLRIHKNGKVCLQWKSSSIFGAVSRKACLKGTKIVDDERFEFQLEVESRRAPILIKARDYETFEMWTKGIKYIFSYAKTFSEGSKAQTEKGKKALRRLFGLS